MKRTISKNKRKKRSYMLRRTIAFAIPLAIVLAFGIVNVNINSNAKEVFSIEDIENVALEWRDMGLDEKETEYLLKEQFGKKYYIKGNYGSLVIGTKLPNDSIDIHVRIDF